jgi:uncharacterized LabA/DUF88 family protein
MAKPSRVMVFIDYQNAYKEARRAFYDDDWDPGHIGQFHPHRLGVKLNLVGDKTRELVGVRVYRGIPAERHDTRAAAASNRQIALWRQHNLVEVITRTLNYRDPAKPREKGIDVALAIDFVTLAVEDYDIGVLFSVDTDLIPALEAVAKTKGPQACESGAWIRSDRQSRPLLLPNQKLGNVHMLSKQDFEHVQDSTDYNVKRRRR